jgi:hypothetical protein
MRPYNEFLLSPKEGEGQDEGAFISPAKNHNIFNDFFKAGVKAPHPP